MNAEKVTLVLLLQIPLDSLDEKPTLRERRRAEAARIAAEALARARHSDPRSTQSRPQQRIILCSPATFRGQRDGSIPAPRGPRVLFVDPQHWSARRHQPGSLNWTLSPYDARPQRLRKAAVVSSTLPAAAGDMSTLLLAARRHITAYRQPAANSLAIAASTAVVAIVGHYLHAQAMPQLHVKLDIAPRLSSQLSLPPLALKLPPLQTARPAKQPGEFAPILSPTADSALRRLVLTTPLATLRADGYNLDITSPGSLWAKTGARFGIDPLLLYAIALVETKSAQANGSIAPTPWLVRIGGRMRSGTPAQLASMIRAARNASLPVQDVGVMQVYYPVHKDIEPDPVALLNPVRNIEVGAGLLRAAMQRTHDPVLKVGYYHSHDNARAQDYGRTVLGVYRALKVALARATHDANNVDALAQAERKRPPLQAGG